MDTASASPPGQAIIVMSLNVSIRPAVTIMAIARMTVPVLVIPYVKCLAVSVC